jgi:two-component system, OmpR family, osmolarity sensor histidine kinase EnvZ
MRILDSLFARVLWVQGLVALLIVLLFAVFAMRLQAQTLARATVPLWVAALNDAGLGAELPRDVNVATRVQLLPGPPPEGALPLPAYPRFRVLAEELRAQGVPLRALRVSGRTGEAVTWLELETTSGATHWVGVRGAFEGTDLRERVWLGFGAGLLAICAGAWWLSRRVVRPLAELRQAMQRFERDGQLPAPAEPGAAAELRLLSDQFAELAHQRQKLDQERSTMLAAISHDLRSPLGRIRMAAELLPEAEGVAPRREAIVRNVQLADRLLSSFIDMTRAEQAPLQGALDLSALLRTLAASDPTLQCVLLSTPLWLSQAHGPALERAVHNLLDNARAHGAPPIQLSLHAHEDQALISVRDHGRGIAAQDRERLMQPFVRGETSRQTPGTGLGLAIVQRTAQRHGGELILQDAAPGLCATLRLPLQHKGA